MISRSLLISCLGLSSICAVGQNASQPAAPSARPTSCHSVAVKPSEGEVLLVRAAYKEAETIFRATLAREADSEEAELGLVRALIGEDKVSEAESEASKMLAAHPRSALAEVASSEAAYRAARVDGAYAHATAAIEDDPCEGRAAVAVASVFDLNGLYARAASLYDHAHRLRPTDELVRRAWIDSLPRKKRQEELARYLEGEHELSVTESRSYGNELQHLKARRPGECRVISKSDTATEKMELIYGDHSQAQSYGLDVLFNGKKRRMQIDTGASGIVLTESAARDLKLDPEYRISTGGVGDEGKIGSYLTHVKSIRIGDVEVSDCMVEVVQKSKLDIEGLIGMDVFSRWLVTLDYPNAEIHLAPLPPRPGAPATTKLESDPLPANVADDDDSPRDRYIAAEMKGWLPVVRIGHNILLQSRIKEGPLHYLIMDTGAGISTLSPAMAREGGKLRDGSDMTVSGLSGEVKKVYSVEHVPLRVENMIIPDAGYFVFDMTGLSHDEGFELSGLLGFPTLQRLSIHIDYRDNLIKLDYDPRHDMHRF